MGHTDLREWLQAVEAHGELKRISGADWDLEMSNVHELILKESKGTKPVLVFDEFPGYPKGYRTMLSPFSSIWRLAMTLGLPEDELDHMTVLRNWRQKRKNLSLIPPKVLKSGPVLTNTDEGDADHAASKFITSGGGH